MTNRIFFIIIVSLFGANYSCEDALTNASSTGNQDPKVAKNIILLIGDGMGLSQLSSAFYFKESIPHFQRFRTIGLINTSSTYKITDSAAGATI